MVVAAARQQLTKSVPTRTGVRPARAGLDREPGSLFRLEYLERRRFPRFGERSLGGLAAVAHAGKKMRHLSHLEHRPRRQGQTSADMCENRGCRRHFVHRRLRAFLPIPLYATSLHRQTPMDRTAP